ncbi:MAG: isochorismatase family protein [Nitriliruptorales bacterium]|nr:isochorismatase family protein [Nitriliruptorales bacterium]
MDERHCWTDVLGADERVLDARGPRERRLGRRPALLLIDLYRKVFGDRPEPLADAIQRWPASCGPAAWAALGPLRDLLAAARAAQVPVIHTTGESRPEATLGGATRRRVGDVGRPADYDIVDAVAPVPGESVIYKGRASAFFGTPLASWLRRLGVDTVVVGGETTSGCVRASVVDAFSHGYDVAVVEEAVFDRSPLSHKVNLYDMHSKYATVVHTVDAVRYLQDPAAHPLAPTS